MREGRTYAARVRLLDEVAQPAFVGGRETVCGFGDTSEWAETEPEEQGERRTVVRAVALTSGASVRREVGPEAPGGAA